MKEIDINIEGYNVNGICVGCLNYNRKMFYRDEVKYCFQLLCDIDVPDGLSVQVCWECLASVRNVLRFRQQVLKSYDVLSSYSKEHTFLNSPLDFTEYSTNRLSSELILTNGVIEVNTKTEDKIDIEVKTEKEDGPVQDDIGIALKKEEVDAVDDAFDSFSQGQDSSDDDMQLSQLKENKEKSVEKKKSKRGRKKKGEEKPQKVKQPSKKSLPEELVEILAVTEEEMWTVRAEDLVSEDFTSKKYKCEFCIISFNTRRLMEDHNARKHQKKGEVCYQCDVCQCYYLTKEHLSRHREWHRRVYACRQCGRRSGARAAAAAHARTHAAHCRTCGDHLPPSKLAYHRAKCHKEKLQCDCCGKVFASKTTLKYHLKSLTQPKEDKPKEKLYIPCRGCNKVFHSKKSYQAHVVIHNGITYPCPTCGKLFQWKRNLARHARNHRERDSGAAHHCVACDRTFASRECYVNHMRLSKRHVPEDAYVHSCNYCGKKFASKWCLVDHIDWDHLKRIKYQCSVCFKAFKTAKIMVTHMRNIHEGKKNKEPDGEHLCEVCGKSYKTVKRLKGHVWAMHTNRSTTKSFKCKLCPATFTWQTSIYKHMKMMHDNTKRSKQPRAIQPVKKQEPYQDIELVNRMQYFQQNLAHTVHPVPVGVVPNIV